MRVEDLKQWHANKEATLAPWNLIVQLVQMAFQTGIVPTQVRLNTLVMIPKPEAGQVCSIGIMEPIWKLISVIINQCMMKASSFMRTYMGSYRNEAPAQRAWKPSRPPSWLTELANPYTTSTWTSPRPMTPWTMARHSQSSGTMELGPTCCASSRYSGNDMW